MYLLTDTSTQPFFNYFKPLHMRLFRLLILLMIPSFVMAQGPFFEKVQNRPTLHSHQPRQTVFFPQFLSGIVLYNLWALQPYALLRFLQCLEFSASCCFRHILCPKYGHGWSARKNIYIYSKLAARFTVRVKCISIASTAAQGIQLGQQTVQEQ